jgi:hypothetical protein
MVCGESQVLHGMRIKTIFNGFKGILYPAMQSAFLLMLLTDCTVLTAAQSNQEAVDTICLKCHNQIAVVLQKKFKHETLAKGCLSCHMD